MACQPHNRRREPSCRIAPALRLLVIVAVVAFSREVDAQVHHPNETDPFRESIRGVWWSPDMHQTAAFFIGDSTIVYPDEFAEFRYHIRRDTLLIVRDKARPTVSLIVRVTPDTLILSTNGFVSLYTRSETNRR